ncbi:unnamed protein product [Bursaphelenchus okinawaensis]|uniref:Uncharacterized protein n=1 Tax=Bursaphelenchus okinawaensis TaxID=465554 RepID=A0A811JRF5_9BILA|nr:unnamed protein product [Bursaphelenchus okinawaensis]CAG9078917.1 unnamed protein product [Bursaphelenchus okinawaensis]
MYVVWDPVNEEYMQAMCARRGLVFYKALRHKAGQEQYEVYINAESNGKKLSQHLDYIKVSTKWGSKAEITAFCAAFNVSVYIYTIRPLGGVGDGIWRSACNEADRNGNLYLVYTFSSEHQAHYEYVTFYNNNRANL